MMVMMVCWWCDDVMVMMVWRYDGDEMRKAKARMRSTHDIEFIV